MALNYRLPTGFTTEARGEADSDWNGFPVPILSPAQHAALTSHLADVDGDAPAYMPEYVDDGKVTPGFYADGLQWERVHDDDCLFCRADDEFRATYQAEHDA